MQIRPTQQSDIADLQTVLDATEMLPEMIKGFLSGQDSDAIWLTCEQDAKAVGFCYAVPEQLAEGTWNMLAVAVLSGAQGMGCGGAIAKRLEDTLKAQGGRILIADTSGKEAFAQTRAFYRKNGYTEEARIRGFWADGDDKIVFWKALTA